MAESPLQVRGERQLEEEERAEHEEAKQQRQPVISSLAAFVKSAFEEAEQHRNTNGVTDRLLESRRLKAGEYEDQKKQAIQQKGGSQLFFNITRTKCEAFEAWMQDVFKPHDDRPWDLQPTPIPSLPEGTAQELVEQTVQAFEQQPDADPEAVEQFAQDLYDQTLQQMYDDAQERCDRMIEKIEDQTEEGGFLDALTDFISDLGTYPSAVIKGPVFVSRKRLKWSDDQRKPVVTQETIPTWYCVDPFNFYPGPNARTVNEAYICEIIDMDKQRLSEMRGVEGWDKGAIDAALGGGAGTATGGDNQEPRVTGEAQRADLEDRETYRNQGMPTGTVRAIEFWGSVPGHMLQEWGMKGIKDKHAYHEVNCIMIGNLVVKAIMNPDPLDRRPYYVTSFIKNKNSLWGQHSVPEAMKDCQEGVNGCQRNLLNNLALASGPQVTVDLDAVPAEQRNTVHHIYPWKVHMYRSTKSNARSPIDFYQPQSNAQTLQQLTEYFEQKADDRTLIPRYVYGNQDMSGAGETASGLSMLMNAATRGIKRVIQNVDADIMRDAINRIFVWNMLYNPDVTDEMKGDAQVIPRGALALLNREQTQVRRQEFLDRTANQIDMQIIGIEGRANILRKVAEGLDMQTDKIVPDEETLRKRAMQQMQQQQQQGQQRQGGQQEQPQGAEEGGGETPQNNQQQAQQAQPTE